MNEITARFQHLVDKLIEFGRVKDHKDFTFLLGISVPSMTEVSKGRYNAGLASIHKTLMSFPDLSAEWLVTGEGNIFKTKSTANVTLDESNKQGNGLENKPKVQKTLPYDEVKVIILDTSGTEVIPIVGISAAAGVGTYNPEFAETLNTIRLRPGCCTQALTIALGSQGIRYPPRYRTTGT